MARGRHPQPAAITAQKAAVRSRRKEPVPAPVEGAVPDSGLRAPAWLKGAGREIWDRRAPMLRSARLLTSADELAFARYCYNFARWQSLRAGMDRKGYTYESVSQHGKLRRVDPNFMIADRLERQLLAIEDRFGMNPAERQRIFAARANTGGAGADLVDRMGDPAASPSSAAEPIESPVGLLN